MPTSAASVHGIGNGNADHMTSFHVGVGNGVSLGDEDPLQDTPSWKESQNSARDLVAPNYTDPTGYALDDSPSLDSSPDAPRSPGRRYDKS